MNLPAKFEIPFDFKERVPLIKARVQEHDLERFLLDTGAPISCLRQEVVEKLVLTHDTSSTVRIDSFIVGGADFGPLDMKVSKLGTTRLEGLLGTREVKEYCVTLYFNRSIAVFDKTVQTHDRPGSALELFRSRPVITVDYMNQNLKFVLDTGSSANWLFPNGQAKIQSRGKIVTEEGQGQSAWGNIPLTQALVFKDMNIGGLKQAETRFLVAQPRDFGGGEKPEDGIIGIGAFADLQTFIIDFPSGRFSLIR